MLNIDGYIFIEQLFIACSIFAIVDLISRNMTKKRRRANISYILIVISYVLIKETCAF